MIITFLGVWMVPEIGETVSFVVDLDSGERILVDTGINTVASLRRCNIDPCSITHLFISHSHGDHISGLPMYLFYRYKYATLINRVQASSLKILATPESWENVKQFVDIPYPNLSSDTNLIVDNSIHDGSKITIGNYELYCFLSAHKPTTIGFKLTDLVNNKFIVYSGDTSIKDSIFDLSDNADCLIHDVVADSTYPMFGKVGHSLCQEVASRSEEKHVKLLIPVHRLPVYSSSENNYEKELKEAFSGKVIIPNDGDVIRIE